MTQTPFIPRELKEEISLRIARLQSLMKEEGMGALLVAGNANIYYTTLRYFRGYVFIPAEGEAVWFVIRPTVFSESSDTVLIRKPEQIPNLLSERGVAMPDCVGLEFDTLSFSDVERLKKALGASSYLNGSPLLRKGRMVKTPWEIREMKEDGGKQVAVYRRIPHLYREDMTDLEFQIEIERVLRLQGGLGYERVAGNLMEINMGSVISGENADTPSPYDFSMGGAGTSPALPVGADGTTMRFGTTVMVDMSGAFNGYQTDLTRVWSIGEISDLARKAHQCSIEIMRALETLAVPGTEVSALYRRAEEIARDHDLLEYFMGHRQQAGFIGHGVGIELNEQPAITSRNSMRLEEGMTLALEPKFVIPGTGAVGIENTYVVRPSRLECLTEFPEEIQSLL